MPSSFTTRRKLTVQCHVESTPDAESPAQAVVTTDEHLAPYKARIESLPSRRQSHRARARKEHEDAVQSAAAVQAQQASQFQADEDHEDSLTSMATLNFHEMPFDRITGLQDAVKRNCNCAKQVRKGVGEAVEDFNRRCLAALQAWMVLPGEPHKMLLKPQCGAVDANSVYLGNPPFAECDVDSDVDKASLPHILCRFHVENLNRTPTMRRKARGIFIERKEITQGVKDYYNYKADCKNLWFFCEKDNDEDFLALVIHGLSDHLDSRYPASVHSNFRQRMENAYQADSIAGIRTQAVFWPYADKVFEEMRGIDINKGIEDGRFWAQRQEERQHRSRRGNSTRAASFQESRRRRRRGFGFVYFTR